MPREVGQREARFEENQKRMREQSKADKIVGLHGAIAVASAKRGKARKVKK